MTSTRQEIHIRPMQATDIAGVLAVQALCYAPAMNESAQTILHRLQQAADFAWVAEKPQGVVAYLVTYPSHLGKLTRLGEAFEVSDSADCLYLHDLAVSPSGKGLGLGQQLVEHAFALARSRALRHAALVSVQDSGDYWSSLGFAPQEIDQPGQRVALASYPAPAIYMTRRLA